MTIEEKAKAYDNAKARISKAYNSNRCTIGFMNEIFPELAESEDEKIRNEIINYIKNSTCRVGNDVYNSWLTWLEKQSEQDSTKWNENLVKEVLLLEVLPCFMHGGEADEVVAKLDEAMTTKIASLPKHEWSEDEKIRNAMKIK